MSHRTLGMTIALVLAGASLLPAAEVEFADGSVVEANVIERTADSVVLAVGSPGGAQARMKVPASRIQRIDDRPIQEVPIDTDDAPMNLQVLAATRGSYAVLDLRGAVGENIFASAVDAAIQQARRAGVTDIVFRIDSDKPGDLDEARALMRVLERHRGPVQLRALVKSCRGPALAVPLYAHSVHFMPGATITGVRDTASLTDAQATLLADIANEIARIARQLGRQPEVVAAMIDPQRSLAVWKSADGRLLAGPVAPADLKPEDLIAQNGPGKPFEITADTMQRAGLKTLALPEELGLALGLTAWTPAKIDLAAAYDTALDTEKKRRADKKRALEQTLTRAAARRDSAQKVLAHALAQAKESDPSGGTYATQQHAWAWGYGYGHGVGTVNTQRLTADSQKEWQLRSDRTLRYLRDAQRAARTLMAGDQEILKLGGEALKDKQDVELLLKELEEWEKHVKAQRDRKWR